MRDQETDREGDGLSIIGGPSLELNRSRSSQLSCLGSGIPWRVGGFGSKVIKCGAGSSLSTSSGSREGWSRGPRLFISFFSILWREVSFVSRVWWGGQGKTDWIERRCLLYSLPLNDGRSQERKEGLEPSTSALARLCSTIKLFPPATVVAKHYWAINVSLDTDDFCFSAGPHS